MRQLIEIAGGGIAGLSLGVALRERGVPVRLFEAGRYPRHRLCGEFLNGVSEETLRSLGVVDLFADACRHREMTWWRGGDFLTRGRLSKAALGLSRWALDQRLAERFVDLGGELCEGQRVKDFRGEGRVDARGRVYQKTSRLLGLKAHF
ncbi:MAG: FAD-dependent monooxygenase [Verrucomicrobiota bacterium]